MEELKEMALGLEDDFVILFDSLDSNVQHFDFKFDFDSLQQNFNMHHFDKEKLHEHLEMNKAHLNRLFDQSKEHYEFIIKENEWIDLALEWNVDQKSCDIFINSQKKYSLPFLKRQLLNPKSRQLSLPLLQ